MLCLVSGYKVVTLSDYVSQVLFATPVTPSFVLKDGFLPGRI